MRRNLEDTFEGLNRLRGRVRRLMDSVFPEAGPAPPVKGWAPRARVVSNPDGLVIELEACGLSRDELDVSLRGTTLTVSGFRAGPADDEKCFFVERPAGELRRSFSLGFPPSSVEASLERGLLRISVRR